MVARWLRSITVKQFIRALEQDGFFLSRVKGSHHIYKNEKKQRVVVSFHSSGMTFAPGTMKKMVREAGWNKDDLKRLKLLR